MLPAGGAADTEGACLGTELPSWRRRTSRQCSSLFRGMQVIWRREAYASLPTDCTAPTAGGCGLDQCYGLAMVVLAVEKNAALVRGNKSVVRIVAKCLGGFVFVDERDRGCIVTVRKCSRVLCGVGELPRSERGEEPSLGFRCEA